jgi:hypothetical protein
MSQMARDFLTRCFAPGETIALLLRNESATTTQQRVVTLEQALASRYVAWLARENHYGANVYVAANPLRSGSRKRTKDCIASIRHLYLDIDTDGDARLAALRASDAVPTPTALLSTSPGKYQVLWQVTGFDAEEQESTLKRLAIAFGGDPACTDCNRVLRIPGFCNRKYSPAHFVAVEYPSDVVSAPSDFRLQDIATLAGLPLRGNARTMHPTKDSRSEQDWAWVIAELDRGVHVTKLTRALAQRRSDKPNPTYYAQRTVDVASAYQWLADQTPIEDVITMLRARRDMELPAALCSARAREIATTAQRMIGRRKIA